MPTPTTSLARRSRVGLLAAAVVALAGCGSSASRSQQSASANAPSASGGTVTRAAVAHTTTTAAVKPRERRPAAKTSARTGASHTTAASSARAPVRTHTTSSTSGRGKLHLETSRVRINLPPLGHQMISTDTAQFPAGLPKMVAYVQLAAANGKDSKPARLGQPLVFGEGDKPLFSVTLGVGYDRKTGLVHVGLRVKNVGASGQAAKRSVVADVTIGYRASA